MTAEPQVARPTLALVASVAAATLVVANVSSLNVALPELSRQLGATQTDVHWMVDIYAVFLAALLLPAGAIGDRYGRRKILLFGLLVLIVSNMVVLGMDSPMPVIIARGVGGIGSAFVFPATLSTITTTLPDELRSRGVAIWTAAVSAGGIVGILTSGVLIESYWWGSVFLAMAIASAAVLVACWFFIPDSADPEEANLDPPGALLAFVGVGALVLGVVEGPVEGWTSPLAVVSLTVGITALTAFILWELRNPKPLLDVGLFREPGVRAGSMSIFVQFTAAFGFFFVTVFYLAFVLGYGPLKTGLGLLPAGIGMVTAALIAIPLANQLGRRLAGTIGLLILAATFFVGLTIGTGSSYLHFAVVMVFFGTGMGLSAPPATEAIIEALPSSKQGVASALNDVLREFGAAIGIAVVGAAFNSGYRSALSDVDGLPAEVVEAVRETPAAAAVVAPTLGEAGPTLLALVASAVVDGWGQAMWVVGIFTVVGALGYALWAPAKQGAPPQESSAPEISIDLRQPAVAVRDPEPVLLAAQASAVSSAPAQPQSVAGDHQLQAEVLAIGQLYNQLSRAVRHASSPDAGLSAQDFGQAAANIRELTAEIVGHIGESSSIVVRRRSNLAPDLRSDIEQLANTAAAATGQLAMLANQVSLRGTASSERRPVVADVNGAASQANRAYRTLEAWLSVPGLNPTELD